MISFACVRGCPARAAGPLSRTSRTGPFCRERWVRTWKACEGQPFRSSNLLSSATLTCQNPAGRMSRVTAGLPGGLKCGPNFRPGSATGQGTLGGPFEGQSVLMACHAPPGYPRGQSCPSEVFAARPGAVRANWRIADHGPSWLSTVRPGRYGRSYCPHDGGTANVPRIRSVVTHRQPRLRLRACRRARRACQCC